MTTSDKVAALNAVLEQDSGKFFMISGFGHRLSGQATDTALPGHWFAYRALTLLGVPVGKHSVCVLTNNDKGRPAVVGRLPESDFGRIFGTEKLGELRASFTKDILSTVALMLGVLAVIGAVVYFAIFA